MGRKGEERLEGLTENEEAKWGFSFIRNCGVFLVDPFLGLDTKSLLSTFLPVDFISAGRSLKEKESSERM